MAENKKIGVPTEHETERFLIDGKNKNLSNGPRMADIRPLKAKAVNFPEPLRTLILSEPDTMEASEFIGKLGTWEKLLKIKGD